MYKSVKLDSKTVVLIQGWSLSWVLPYSFTKLNSDKIEKHHSWLASVITRIRGIILLIVNLNNLFKLRGTEQEMEEKTDMMEKDMKLRKIT
jgi:hypothetical protein